MKLIVNETSLAGVKLLTTDRFEDLRGEYGGVYDEAEYLNAGITTKFVADQVSMSHKGVLRGIHGDKITTKLVQCLHGTVYSVVVDCNVESPTFGKWEGFVLSDKNHKQLLVPPLYGLSYFAQSNDIIFTYKLSHAFSDEQFTFRWNDPRFNIHWPSDTPIQSARDKGAQLCSERGLQ